MIGSGARAVYARIPGTEFEHVYLARRKTALSNQPKLHGSTRLYVFYKLGEFCVNRMIGSGARKLNVHIPGTEF